MTYLEKLKRIDLRRKEGKYAERICSELVYLDNLSDLHGGKYDALIERAADFLLSKIDEDGVITKAAVFEAEAMLSELAPKAKSLKEIFIGHAHIDMNWMWGYNETAVITVDTFKTMLKLMREYPEFTFAQSQASTYQIIEKYRPDMLEEIKERIREGRWEVTAAEWVEPDKNMPSGESLTRQVFEARKYLSELLGISAESLDIDYVPDTFGHAVTIPEILADAGVKYMYHCRGGEGNCVYKYRAPSGKEILTYREFAWYNTQIGTDCFESVPRFCKKEKLDTYLCVYGVGDHGGGPTRRDIEKILEYRSWPLTPDIKFGTYREFFDAIEASGNDFPVVDSELNFLFSGCYTTQARIKMANRLSEARAFEAEALAAEAEILAGVPCNQKRFEEPWRNILFGHFHDIIPGSGTVETREHALGKFQDTLAALQVSASASMNAVADEIDTSSIEFDGECNDSCSEGAGVGYRSGEDGRFAMPSAERGRGLVRAIHLFNPTAYDRHEVTEITVWDYAGDNRQTVITDIDGNELEFALAEDMQNSGEQKYWGHTFKKFKVLAKVPAFGYTTLVVKQRAYEGRMSPTVFDSFRTDHRYVNNEPFVLENEKIYARFDRTTASLTKLVDKRTGEELINAPSCFFRYAEENTRHWGSAWRIGEYMKCVNLNEQNPVKIAEVWRGKLFNGFSYSMEFDGGKINAAVTLNKNSEMLDFDVKIDWAKQPIQGKMVPQISFVVPVAYKLAGKSLSEIPYGVATRNAAAFDVPSHGALGILGEGKHIIALLADTKYGFRHYGNEGQITLVRNAYYPDPCSDCGVHRVRIGVAACEKKKIGELASSMLHPMPHVAGGFHGGKLGLEGRLLKLSGNVRVSALKGAEDGKGIVVRLYDVTGIDGTAELEFCRKIASAELTDTNETPISPIVANGRKMSVQIPHNSVVTIKIELEK